MNEKNHGTNGNECSLELAYNWPPNGKLMIMILHVMSKNDGFCLSKPNTSDKKGQLNHLSKRFWHLILIELKLKDFY